MKRMKYPVVAFAGAIGSGKSTAAGVLREVVSLRRMSFAQPIRAMLEALGVPADRLTDPVLKAAPIAWLGGRTPRQLMQTLGTEWGRAVCGPDIWTGAVQRAILAHMAAPLEGWRPVVLDDCRFDNEAAMVRRLGGVVVQIVRTGHAASAHASEQGISPELVDAIVSNDGTEEELQARLCALLVREEAKQ
jgi:hypothetical protein